MSNIGLDSHDTRSPPPAVSEQLQVPQFGILHLLILTTITAVLLKVLMAFTGESFQESSPVLYWVSHVVQAMNAIILAATMVGSGVLLRLRFYTMVERLQPGHWLVLISMLDFILTFILTLAAVLLYWLVGVLALRIAGIYRAGVLITLALEAVAYGYSFWRLRDALRWKLLIGAKGLGLATAATLGTISLILGDPLSTWPSLYPWMLYGSLAWSLALFLFLAFAASLDLWQRAARDWMHWLGVGVIGLNYAMQFVSMISFQLFFQLGR
jgi:hypothetical protein